jgi:hypothetical protein
MTEPTKQMYSPFKFLDPYGREDRDIFFGRNEEVENLYQYVNKNRLVLVYGQSGTGKTSLVQCGLANRFEVTDWVPFFIRRGKNINESFRQVISQSKALGGAEVKENQLNKALERISARYLRPVYLIFDQFEELLILGDEAEKEQFLITLEDILEADETQSCNLLFIMREEYFAWLDGFERRIPGFSDRRLRVEPMRPARIGDVITQSCAHFNITLEQPQENAQQIIRSLSSKTGISLPYLQVYLDMFWREDYARTYPDSWQEEGYPPLHFSTQEIEGFGAIRDVLERFLQERREGIQHSLAHKYRDVPPDTVRNVLDAFATEEGTKRPINYNMEMGIISVAENAPDTLHQIPSAVLIDCLLQLEQSRILRTDGDTYELAHDTLANLIDQQRTDAQRQRNEIRRRILTSYHGFGETGEYLTRKQLTLYEESIPFLRLDTPVVQYLENSRRYVEEQEKQVLAAEKRKRRQATFIAAVGFILALGATGASIVAINAQKRAESAEIVANEKQKEAEIAKLATEETLKKLLEKKREKDKVETDEILRIVDKAIDLKDFYYAETSLLDAQNSGNTDERIGQKLNELNNLKNK